jgi:drug/metabolite transporter (DMT)-like permease
MWGSSFLWIAESLEAFSPFVVTLTRLLLGAATLGMFRAARAPVERSDLPRIALLGLVWMAIPLLLFPIAQQWVDSSIAGAINGSTPLFAAVIAALMLQRRPGAYQATGLVVGFTGVLLVTLPSGTGASGSPLGILLLVAASALYGFALNLIVPLVQRYGSLPVLLRAQMVAIVITLPVGIGGLPGSSWSWSAAAAVAVLGTISTGVAFVAMGVLSARVGATRAAIPIFLLPVVAMVLGVAFRSERVPALAVAGTLLVIAGAWLSSRREP